MLTTSATNLRNHLFEYLEKVANGETIIVIRNNTKVAKLVPPKTTNWRDYMKTKVKICVPPDKLIEPIEDIWQEYV